MECEIEDHSYTNNGTLSCVKCGKINPLLAQEEIKPLREEYCSCEMKDPADDGSGKCMNCGLKIDFIGYPLPPVKKEIEELELIFTYDEYSHLRGIKIPKEIVSALNDLRKEQGR